MVSFSFIFVLKEGRKYQKENKLLFFCRNVLSAFLSPLFILCHCINESMVRSLLLLFCLLVAIQGNKTWYVSQMQLLQSSQSSLYKNKFSVTLISLNKTLVMNNCLYFQKHSLSFSTLQSISRTDCTTDMFWVYICKLSTGLALWFFEESLVDLLMKEINYCWASSVSFWHVKWWSLQYFWWSL